MHRIVLSLVVAIVILAAHGAAADAGIFRRHGVGHYPPAATPVAGPRVNFYGNYAGYYAPGGTPSNPFPQYYGGFHARYFQDIGVPPGDKGIRGYAW